MTKQTNFKIQTGILALCFFFATNSIVADDDAQTRKPSPVSCCTPGVGANPESAVIVLDVSSGGTGDSSFNINQVVVGGTTSTGPLAQVVGATTGKILTATGATSLPTFQALSANVQVFTTVTNNATYTPTAGTKYVVVEMVGGGGGSAGGAATSLFASSGGGSGSYSRRVLTIGQIGATLAYTIGIGGSAGVSGGGSGGTGGTTSLAALVTALGGVGSVTATAGALAGGAGGALGTGGVFTGRTGAATIVDGTFGSDSGTGADSPLFGQGGYSVQMNTTGATPGTSGQGFGAGAGGGTAGVATPAVFLGGTGAGGAMIITEYILA